MENKYTTELVILDDTITVSTLKIIKKYRDDSYFNIKNDVSNGKSILSCDSVDIKEYKKLLKCYKELVKNKVKAQIVEDGEVVETKLAENWLNSMRDTEKFVNSDDSWLDQ